MNFGCLILIIAALLSGGWFAWDWYSQRPHRERVVAEKASFMKEFNPQLKSLHDKLQAELDSCEANLKNLKGLARSFNQPNAKAAVEGKIRVFEGKAESLRGQLNRIEEEAEKGVALRTFNQIDGGGMVDQDMSELLKDSQSVLSDAVNSRKQMATEFGQPSMDDIDETRVTSKSSSSTGNRVAVVKRVSAEITTYRVVRTSDGYLNMRTGPGLGYPSRGRILGTARGLIQIGELVYDRKDDIQWMPVRIGGVEGFVSSNFLQRE
jgi:hypothetical protein